MRTSLRFFMFMLLLSAAVVAGCQPVTPEPEPDPDPDPEKDTTTIVIPEDKDSIETVVDDESYLPVSLKSSVTHVQPMNGMVLWNDQARNMHGTHGQCIALEFSYIQVCKLVTGKSGGKLEYDWTYLEDKLADAASRDHQMVLRFPLCYPSNRDNCSGKKGATYVPDYIKEMEGYEESYAANPGGDGPTYYPDWSNAELQWFLKQFYKDLNEHYGADKRIAFLEVGFGHWGEGHTYGTTVQFGKNFPTHEYQKELFGLLGSMMRIPWLMSIDMGDETYSRIASDKELMSMRFGLFDDSFMHREHDLSQGDGWNEQCWQWSGMDRWKKGVCGGEISYYSSKDQRGFLNPEGLYGVTWEQAAGKYHMTFVICNDAPEGSYFTTDRVTEAGIHSGYRFQITACTTNGKDTHVTVTNTGIAPIYRDAYITVAGVRAGTSLRGMLPGEERRYAVAAVATSDNVSITSDHILPSQEIQFDADL